MGKLIIIEDWTEAMELRRAITSDETEGVKQIKCNMKAFDHKQKRLNEQRDGRNEKAKRNPYRNPN